MARLYDRFDPDREKWSSYLMRAEFCFYSNNITTDQKKKATLCSTMSPETFTLLQNVLTREVTDVSYEEVKGRLNSISRKNAIFWLNCAKKPNSVILKNNAVLNARKMHYEIGL